MSRIPLPTTALPLDEADGVPHEVPTNVGSLAAEDADGYPSTVAADALPGSALRAKAASLEETAPLEATAPREEDDELGLPTDGVALSTNGSGVPSSEERHGDGGLEDGRSSADGRAAVDLAAEDAASAADAPEHLAAEEAASACAATGHLAAEAAAGSPAVPGEAQDSRLAEAAAPYPDWPEQVDADAPAVAAEEAPAVEPAAVAASAAAASPPGAARPVARAPAAPSAGGAMGSGPRTLTQAIDTAAKLAADANAAAEALDSLKRLLQQGLPGAGRLPPRPAPGARQPPQAPRPALLPNPPPVPTPAYARRLPVAAPPPPPPPEPTRFDVRGFLAGFALSWAIGVVLYLFMTAG